MFKKSFFVFTLLFSSLFASLGYGAEPDIRYRTIVYFYPGTEDLNLSLLKEEFKDFKFVDEFPESALEPIVSYRVTKEIKSMIPVPDLEYLSYFGRGLTKEQASKIQDCSLATVIDVAYPMSMTFDGLKKSGSSIFNYAESVNGLIWDSETRELFTPDAWKLKRVDSWVEIIPVAEDHTVIHAYQNDTGVRAITLGMAKLGLPDIAVNDFAWSSSRSMGNLINLVAQSLTEGLAPNKQGGLELNINNIKNAAYKKELQESLMEHAKSEVTIFFGLAQREEGDPNNYIIELLFDNAEGDSLSERQEVLLSNLFGWEDQISYVKHNEMILAASERARKKLNGLRKDFNDGLDPGEYIQLKAPFATPDGGDEWMWVEVISWKGNEIKGILRNEPFNIPDLKSGAEVVVKQQDIFDFIRVHSDGTRSGNQTGALIMKYQKK